MDNVTAVHAMFDADILQRIAREREAQQSKWGEQSHPLGDFVASGALGDIQVNRLKLYEAISKQVTDQSAEAGEVTWHMILNEELAEVAAADDLEKLCEELIQTAAVCVAIVRDVRRTLTP
jgi:hypothetical protein